ncbi:hypothetical protein FHX77_001278 [Bifidobacterium commune]|uniref:Uncharacterized protein n=1 Tax=Bifidobacterium commune TaxID=1505727 RepID=A0A1C4H598_9BIFI|nr:hypothetical protein [Bifidobacterium commune]SCC79818.1 hypothetical protein GA0061077_0839 [Bifidobacterium commune]
MLPCAMHDGACSPLCKISNAGRMRMGVPVLVHAGVRLVNLLVSWLLVCCLTKQNSR